MTRTVLIRKRTRHGGIQAFEPFSVPDVAAAVADVAPSSLNPAPDVASRAGAGALARAGASGGDYEVGYKKPPLQHRFKPGQSGNPKGRPRGKQSPKDYLMESLLRLVPMTIDGEKVMRPALHVAFEHLVQKSIRGDLKAFALLHKLRSDLFDLDAVQDEREPALTQNDLSAYLELLADQLSDAGLSRSDSSKAIAVFKALAGIEGVVPAYEEEDT